MCVCIYIYIYIYIHMYTELHGALSRAGAGIANNALITASRHRSFKCDCSRPAAGSCSDRRTMLERRKRELPC